MGSRDVQKRIDVTGPAESLTSRPFAQLGRVAAENADVRPAPVPAEKTPAKSGAGFAVARTRKGGYPIFVERRGAGKVVTVVRNVSGDAEKLAGLLKKRCASGGRAIEGAVEVQGDHAGKVEAILREMGM
jgi:translation initiation factor 1 (eIF-1/SUI1)